MSETLNAQLLIVDDDPGMRSLLHAVLTEAGATAWLAKNDRETLTALRSHTFDAVLLDLNLAGTRGEDLFDEIRLVSPEISIFPMSGCLEDEMRQRLADRSYAALIQKPFNTHSLLNTLKRTIQPARLNEISSERI